MSFYRSALAAIAALALVGPVFADDTTSTGTTGATESTTTQTTTTTSSTEQTKVDVNKATKEELMKVKGINAAKALSIIKYRKSNGDFKSLDDLSKVTGFKNMNSKTLKGIQDQLSVE
jgi:competence protein ComEA